MKTIRYAHSLAIGMAMELLITISGCSVSKSWQKEQGMIWNTIWHATYLGTPDLMTAAIDTLQSVSASLSVFDPESLVSAVNISDSVPVDAHFEKVYEMSVEVHKRSNGMFDPTISPLIQAWGFGKGHTPTADTARIDLLLTKTGLLKTHIKNGLMLKEDPDIEFNFSAIAKGYGVDQAANALLSQDCGDFMIEIGGEVVCRGLNPDKRKWKILIETPDEEFLAKYFPKEKLPQITENLVVELTDEALATSGNYRNYFENTSGTYGHTISPLTGRPVRTDILSASVIAPTCMEADAMSTACMALGSKDGMQMLEKAGLAGAFILDNGEILLNPNMKKRLKN